MTAESGWGSATTAYQFGTAQTLAADRTAAALRYTGGANSLALNSFTLKTNGILNGGSGLLTVSGLGALTATGVSGGNLFLTTGSTTNNITVSSAINDNGGAVAVVKGGAGTLTLSSTTSNYTGGTVINAGTLATTADSNLGSGGAVTFDGNATWNLGGATPVTYNRDLIINEGATASFASGNGAKTISGIVSGNGSLVWNVTTDLILSNTANTFNGTVTVTTGGTNPYGFSAYSLGDEAGAGNVNLGGTTTTGYFYWYGSAKTFNDRQFALSGTTAGGVIDNRGTGALTITKDLAVTGIGNKAITLGGTNADANTYSGIIADGAGSVVGVTKTGTNTWILSGANTYSGLTFINGANGTLITSGTNSSAGATTIQSGTSALQ